MTNIIIKKTNKKNLAFLFLKKKKFFCHIGKNGIRKKNREGDMITPKGIYKMKEVYFRYDRLGTIKSKIPKKKIHKNSIWITDPKNQKYNLPSNKPCKYLHEKLSRNDNLYDIVITTTFNTQPTKKFKGSAIFIHCSNKKTKFTEGCIALKKQDLITILKFITPASLLVIY